MIPYGESASTTAFITAAVDAIVPVSPTPLTPSGFVVLGVSADGAASHKKFAAKYKLPFPLLSDPDRKVMTAWGAYGYKMMYGKKTKGVIRSTVWIGPDGVVRKHWARVADAAKHLAQVLEQLRGEAPAGK